MALVLTQQPNYGMNPASQEFIFSITEDSGLLVTQTGVKIIAEVYVSSNKANTTSYNSNYLVATLKTTPNNAGAGMFDFRPIVESFVTPDYEGTKVDLGNNVTSASTFKGLIYEPNERHFPIHIIDHGAVGYKSTTWMTLKFKIEYLNGNPALVNQIGTDPNEELNSRLLFVFNGVLYNEDYLSQGYTSPVNYNFGYNYDKHNLVMNDTDATFLTQAPEIQYARMSDYGTLSFFNMLDTSTFGWETGGVGATEPVVINIRQILYNSSGAVLGTFTLYQNVFNEGGAGSIADFYSYGFLVYMGMYPANFDNFSIGGSDWYDNRSDISYYTLQAEDDNNDFISKKYTINIICENSFGYEGIRLTWLNKYGTWDYYTFNQKSVRSVSTKKSTYTQLGGTWNELTYKPSGHKGGKKNFRTNAKEKIKLNTDFLSNNEGEWLENVITSPEVYIVNPYSSDDTTGLINKYVEPVLVTTSNFVRKTTANDKLIQYTIEIERNKSQRQQSM
jgi:hypothetical protein